MKTNGLIITLWLLLLVLCGCTPGTVEPASPSTAEEPKQAATSLPAVLPQATAQKEASLAAPTPSPVVPATAQPQPAALPTLQGPLSVVIASPADGAVVQQDHVDITGTADPDTVLSIDDQILVVGAGGKFTQQLTLEEGPNVIEITASDPMGNQATVYLTLIYDPNP